MDSLNVWWSGLSCLMHRTIALCLVILLGSLLPGLGADLLPTPGAEAVPPVAATAKAQCPAAGPLTNLPPLLLTNAASPIPGPGTNAPLPKLGFQVGEELSYYIFWANVLVGRATIITSWASLDDKPVIKITYWVRSNKTLSRLYPVQDLIVTTVDPATFRPIRFDMDMKEGKFTRKEVTTFDYRTMTATWTSLTKKKTRTFPIEADTRDLMTFLYFVRSEPFKLNDERKWRVMADDKIYDLAVKVSAQEKVELPKYGRVRCFRLDPTAQFEGLFVRTGTMTLWVSKDPRNLCTQVEAQVPVGSVRAILNEVRGPGNDFWINKLGITNAPAESPSPAE